MKSLCPFVTWRLFLVVILGLGIGPVRLFGTSLGNPAPSYNSKLWTPGEDPAGNTVQAIAQTADGFLWVGTQNGLARFDGEGFELFQVGEGGIKSQKINALCTDTNGDLWVGSSEGLFQLKDGRWIPHAMPLLDGDHIMSLRRSSNGSLLIGTLTGLAGFEKEMSFLWGDVSSRRSMGSYSIRSISESYDGEFWVSAADNLVRFKDGEVTAKRNFSSFRADLIRSVCRTRGGQVWMGATSGLILIEENRTLHFTKTDGLPDNTVTAIYEDRRGNLWIGTYGGLCRLVNDKFVIETTPEGEPYNQILCFFEDREDNLWIGSKEGLHRLNVQPFTTYTTRHGLAHNNVISVYEDSQTNLWIGTWGGGLHRVKNGELKVYSSANTGVMRNDLVLAIHGSKDGGIWFGEDYDGGLYRLREDQLQHFGEAEGLTRNAIRAVLEDRNGRLLIGLAAGYLKVLEQGKFNSYGKSHGLPTNAIRCLLQAQDGGIWIGTESGLVLWENETFTTFTKTNGLSDDTVLSLYEDPQHILWIGTATGLNRMHREKAGEDTARTNASFTFDHRNELSREAILEILEDDFGNLWLATRSGVLRVTKTSLEDLRLGRTTKLSPTLFGKADGMASQVCVAAAKPSAFKSKDGRLWFATTKGLAVTDPRLQIAKNEKPPFVVVREVLADKRNVTSLNSSLIIPPGRGELEFRYTALSYSASEKNRFKYKLEGLDSDWIDAGTRRVAHYNNVPPGDYTFHVIASNNDGVWNLLGKSVKLSLHAHYWQTWWFKICGAFSSFGLVAIGARMITRRRMQWKLERVEQQHAVERERTRIARDMHDDLGGRLTQILLLNDRAQNSPVHEQRHEAQTAIAEVTRGIAQNLDAIVWAVNPKNDTLEKTALYLWDYVEKYLARTSMRCRSELPEDFPGVALSSEVRHNLFLIVKEAVHNIVKHSGATEVWFRIRLDGPLMLIAVEDNGRGFELADPSLFGNGLQNMEARMKSLGGEFQLLSGPGKGTRVDLKIPLIQEGIY